MSGSMIKVSLKFSAIAFIINLGLRIFFEKILPAEHFANSQQVVIARELFLSLLLMLFIGLAHREYKHKFRQLSYKKALSIGLTCILLVTLFGLLWSEILNFIYFLKDSRSPLRMPWFSYFIFPAIDIFLMFTTLLAIEGQWLLFRKANQPGWACLVPVYNLFIMLKIAKYNWNTIFIFLIPVVNIGFYIIILNTIVKRFGKTPVFTLGLIFLPFIFYPVIGLGKAEYAANTLN